MPEASDDELIVGCNSIASPVNTIDVSTNDFIGTTNGGDSDNYSLSSLPLNTVNDGTVTEGSYCTRYFSSR